jgi:hypothetical protein
MAQGAADDPDITAAVDRVGRRDAARSEAGKADGNAGAESPQYQRQTHHCVLRVSAIGRRQE